jgi:hypothetical protein
MEEERTPTDPSVTEEAAGGPEQLAPEAPPSEAVAADANAAETAQPPAEAEPPPAVEQAPPAEPPAPAAEQPATTPAESSPPAEPPAPAAEQPAPAAEPPAPAAEQPAPADQQPAAREQQAQRGGGKPRRDRPRRDRGQRPRRDRGGPRQPQQRASGPLPFQELRDAATTVVDLFGARQALRDAFTALGEKERRDLSRLVAEDGDWRVRARNIAAGSLGAGRVGKALAAQQISMARVEDLWPLTLSKEEAAARQSRVRSARRRDERRSQRDAEREQRTDRVSRADLQKAQDGRVGAQIRIIIGGQQVDRPRDKRKDEDKDEQPKKGSDVLDRLGY